MVAGDLRFKYFQRTVGIDQWYLRQFITGTIEMARIRGESGPRFTFDAHRSRERFLRARATRVGAGFRESVEERAGSVLFWWIRLTGTVEQVYGLCGNIYLKRPLRYGRTELSVRPRGETTPWKTTSSAVSVSGSVVFPDQNPRNFARKKKTPPLASDRAKLIRNWLSEISQITRS